jgi:hypothetical protein
MVLKKTYKKPELNVVRLDNIITLMMLSIPDPLGNGQKNTPSPGNKKNTPFASPFGDKPFG